MTILYYHGSCPPCLKAKTWLEYHQIPFTARDIEADFFTPQEMADILQACENGPTDILSEKSAKQNGIDVDIPSLQPDEIVALLKEHLELLKKPLIIQDGKLHTQYNEKTLEAFFAVKN